MQQPMVMQNLRVPDPAAFRGPGSSARVGNIEQRMSIRANPQFACKLIGQALCAASIHPRRDPATLAPIISAQGLSKRYGIAPLFQNISFAVSAGDRIGLIGPNGSGKSTLLAILDGRVKPDAGEVAVRKGTRLSCVAQVSEFAPGATIRSVIDGALDRIGAPHEDRAARVAETLGRAGFSDFDIRTDTLSGGWKKRLAIAESLVQHPDILLLDEPTNHLDLAGIKWVEALLRNAPFACVIVSHDRYFLENVTNETVELSRAYSDGYLRVSGNYSAFLEAKAQHLHAQQKRQDALENRVRTEIEWLRRGPKARTTKSKSRIDSANEMIVELADLNARTRTASAGIDFSASGRQTKQLVQLDGVSYSYPDSELSIEGRTLFSGLHFTLTAGMRVGLVGPNGSGKTTLLRLLRGDIGPISGQIRNADGLRIVYFDQNRVLDPNLTLRRALAPDSDSVIYQDRVIHVGGWATRFLFTSEDLNRPVSRLSGGERARVLIAQLMLQPADLLLLDEPTNDLDIPTLELLEESLLEFRGALALVTHDRYMLDRVSTVVLGLDGFGGFGRFASYSQWEAWQSQQQKARNALAKSEAARPRANPQKHASAKTHTGVTLPPPPAAKQAHPIAPVTVTLSKKKLSFTEVREFETIEQRIAETERELETEVVSLSNPTATGDPAQLRATTLRIDELHRTIESLYARWSELEQKKA
jgi:ATP-binding cassette subfamily F protein uup